MTEHLTSFVSKVREMDLKTAISLRNHRLGKELGLLHADSLDEDLVRSSLNALLKYEDDLSSVVDNP